MTWLKIMQIGFIGIGLMGLPMAEKIASANIPLMVYNRTPSKLQSLSDQGVTIADSYTTVLNSCDCIILMLTNAEAIAHVLFADSTIVFTNKTIISMATISPVQSQEIRDKIVSRGGEYLEAPVLGSIPEAKSGNLIVMVGSTEEQYDRYLELLKNFSPEPIFIGEVGKASALKLALNQLISALTTGFAQSLGFLQKSAVNTDLFMNILRESALYAPTFDKKLQRMLDGNYVNPNFPTKHLLKDTNLFIESAEKVGVNVSSIQGIKQVIEMAMKNHADDDYSALYSAIIDE
jgi:3-hydroxyisobutyrate dehydrogenase